MYKLAVAALVGLSVPVMAAAQAPTNLVKNGGFESVRDFTASSQFVTRVENWTNEAKPGQHTGYGYNFIMKPGTADTTGFTSFAGNLDYLYGPNGQARPCCDGSNQSANGLTATSPSGGNYILADGDTGFHGRISQTIEGLEVGKSYDVSFEWAGAAWFTTPGDTTHRWDVSLGSTTLSTETLSMGPKGFTGWKTSTLRFVAGGSTQVLAFLAQGTPNGLPPTLLLDNVSMTAVPEPATWALMVVGFGLVGASARRRRGRTVLA